MGRFLELQAQASAQSKASSFRRPNGRPRLRISSYGLDFVAQALLPVLFVLPLAFCPPLL